MSCRCESDIRVSGFFLEREGGWIRRKEAGGLSPALLWDFGQIISYILTSVSLCSKLKMSD